VLAKTNNENQGYEHAARNRHRPCSRRRDSRGFYVAVGAACLILGLCMYLSPDLFANYFGLAILTAAWIVVGLAYLVVCALSNLWDWWDERRNL
jgi:hypothetical protein